MKESNPAKIILVIILLIAAGLRLCGIFPGYPPYHSDEGISYSSAVSMIKNGNLDPLRYDYPSLVPLINFVVFKIVFIPFYWAKFYINNFNLVIDGFLKLPLDEHSYKRIFQLDILGDREIHALAWGRITTAVFGVGVVYLLWIIAKKLYNWQVAAIASFLLAVNYRHVLNSHIGLPDIYNSFFLLLSILTTILLYFRQSKKEYFFAGLSTALSFSTKYQIFSFLPLFITHLFMALKERTIVKKIKFLFRIEAFLCLFTVLLFCVFLNPYFFINFEQAFDQVSSVALKYATGRNILDLFGIAYLYNIGLGSITSIFVFVGILFLLFKHRYSLSIFLLILVPFFYVTNYLTIGGFYTRNYVTIIPILVLISAYGMYEISNLVFRFLSLKYINLIIVVGLLVLSSKDQIYKSTILARTYTEQWNFIVMSQKIEQNLPDKATVAAHSSVPTKSTQEKLPFEMGNLFSVSEFREAGAEYAIGNLDWMSVDFYWWMTAGPKDGFRYINKPLYILEETFPALAARELSDFTIFKAIKPWQAPDSNFFAAVIPEYSIENEELISNYTFDEGVDGWEKTGKLWNNDTKLTWANESLHINQSGESSKILHWQSPLLNVKPGEGFIVRGKIRSEAVVSENERDGFLRVDFYNGNKKISTRLSARLSKSGLWENKEVIGIVPTDANNMRIGFQVYNMTVTNFDLDEISVYKATVRENLRGKNTVNFYIPDDILFPNSHGGL